MNERIEELIVAYLHRGSTPEQERELFEACRDDADVAQLLRRHLTLSLKIRRLRDETEVPPELHARLVGRINEIEHEGRSVAAPFVPKVSTGLQRLVFGWRHLAGTAIAGAALATTVFLLLPGRSVEPDSTARVVTVTDTLRETRIDTLVATRTVYRAATRATAPVAMSETLPAQDDPVAPPVLQEDAPVRSEDFTDIAPVRPARTGIDVRRGTAGESSESSMPSYIEQYTMMVSSLDQIMLTSQDRVR
jgi:hypothetical protein